MTNIDTPLPYDPSDGKCYFVRFQYWGSDNFISALIDSRVEEAVRNNGFTFEPSDYFTTTSIEDRGVWDERLDKSISQHRTFNWEETPESDILSNIEAISTGGRILSWHSDRSGSMVVVTSEDRKSTTVFYASEYVEGQVLPDIYTPVRVWAWAPCFW
jgi:hypothetical protein